MLLIQIHYQSVLNFKYFVHTSEDIYNKNVYCMALLLPQGQISVS